MEKPSSRTRQHACRRCDADNERHHTSVASAAITTAIYRSNAMISTNDAIVYFQQPCRQTSPPARHANEGTRNRTHSTPLDTQGSPRSDRTALGRVKVPHGLNDSFQEPYCIATTRIESTTSSKRIRRFSFVVLRRCCIRRFVVSYTTGSFFSSNIFCFPFEVWV